MITMLMGGSCDGSEAESEAESESGSDMAGSGRNTGDGTLEVIMDGRNSVFCFNCRRCSKGEVYCLTVVSITNFLFSASISS